MDGFESLWYDLLLTDLFRVQIQSNPMDGFESLWFDLLLTRFLTVAARVLVVLMVQSSDSR